MIAVAAQDTQRFETFGGYSFTHGSAFLPSGSNSSGWDTSTTVFLKRWFGITSDFAGHYVAANFLVPYPPPPYVTPGVDRETAHSYSFLFGPHFTYRHSRYAPFVQSLFGVQHNWVSDMELTLPTCTPPATCGSAGAGSTVSGSETKFAMAVGGGLDIALGHGIFVRPVQAEYLLNRLCCEVVVQHGIFHAFDYNSNAFRYSTGITFRFGQHLGRKQ
ncbi:MAG TPA: hypothetical protein VL240_09895 [Candidatus Binatia bacterium]|nr:hypothetical protein [Candidatus Binatia bacterium]